MKKVRKIQPFKAWLLVDDLGTYEDKLFLKRAEAVDERDSYVFFRDAQWRIVPLRCEPW